MRKTLEKASISLSYRHNIPDKARHALISIRIKDENAKITFAEVEIKAADFADLLSSLQSRPCKVTVRNLENVGKTMERGDKLVFEMPDANYHDGDLAKKLAVANCPEGWLPQLYFGSQNSFFTKSGITYARTSTYRWVDALPKDDLV